MSRSAARRQIVYDLRRKCTARGIRYVNHIESIPRLEAILADPYDQYRITYNRYWDIDSFDFRGKGITPKPGAWVRWNSLPRGDRMRYACRGRFREMVGDFQCRVTYALDLGFGYKNKSVIISIFQIVDYSEEK